MNTLIQSLKELFTFDSQEDDQWLYIFGYRLEEAEIQAYKQHFNG